MPIYQPLIPTGSVPLNVDYQNLQDNFSQLNTVYGIDHYAFDALTHIGHHNKVTTPAYVENPATGLPPATTTDPIFYAFQQYAALGVLQYSRGPSNVIPTPVTYIQSQTAPITMGINATINILDFTGIAYASTLLHVIAPSVSSLFKVSWSLVSGTFGGTSVDGQFTLTNSGSILQIINTGALTNNIYWTLQLLRIG